MPSFTLFYFCLFTFSMCNLFNEIHTTLISYKIYDLSLSFSQIVDITEFVILKKLQYNHLAPRDALSRTTSQNSLTIFWNKLFLTFFRNFRYTQLRNRNYSWLRFSIINFQNVIYTFAQSHPVLTKDAKRE